MPNAVANGFSRSVCILHLNLVSDVRHSALRNTSARPAARRPSGIPASRNSSARSAERSRRTTSIASGESRRARSGEGTPGTAGRGARMADRAAQRAVPVVPGGHGVRSGARRTELRVLRLAGARGLPGDQGADPPAGRAAVQDRREPRARRHPPLVAQPMVRAGPLAVAALVDTVRSLYIPYWTFDAQVHCPWTAEAGYHYTVMVPGRDAKGRTIMRPERRTRWEPASGVVDHFFDDEPVPGNAGAADRSAAAGRAVSDAGDRGVRHRVSLRPRRRALSGRPARRGAAIAGADERQAAGAVRAAGARRHPSQSAHQSELRRAGRSSTSSCRSGCCRTTTARRRIR